MKWPFRKYVRVGKRAISQQRSNQANVRRELRENQSKRPRSQQFQASADAEITICPYCGFEAWGTFEEVHHMEAQHPDIIEQGLQNI